MQKTKTTGKLLIISLTLVVVMLFILTGCSDSVEYEEYDEYDLDIESIIQQEWNNSISSEQPEFLNLFDQKSSYQITDITEETEGYYSVVMDVSSPDISVAITEYQAELEIGVYGDNVSESDMDEKICEIINSADMKTTQQTISVIVDTDGVAHVNFTQDFINAMFGYIYNDAMENVANLLQ